MTMERRLARVLFALALIAGCGEQREDLDLVRARNAMDQARPDWARTYYARDRRRHPDRLESLYGEALAWSQGYQRSRARTRELLAEYLQRRPNDQEALMRYLRELLVIRDFEGGRSRLAALDRRPGADLLRAQFWIEDEPEKALELVNGVVENSPETAAAWVLKAELEEKLGRLAESVESARRALALDPFQYAVAYRMARTCRQLGRVEEADRALEIYSIGAVLESDGTRPQVDAGEELVLLRRLGPLLVGDDAGAYQRRLVAALFRNGLLTEAMDAAERELATRAHTTADLVALAVLADEAGARALATRLFEDVVHREPDHLGATSSLILIDIEGGRQDRARRRLDEAQRRHPRFARFDFLRGRLEVAGGRTESAVASYRRALDLAPWEWGWRIALVELELARGDRSEARRLVEEAPEQPPGWLAWRAGIDPALGVER